MSPIKINPDAGAGDDYGLPFIGPVHHTASVPILLTIMSNKEIDSKGYLRPGIPISDTNILVGIAPAFVYGVTVAPIKVAADNAAGTIAALGTIWVAVATICQVNRALAEAILERVYTANEIAGFERAGSKCVLID